MGKGDERNDAGMIKGRQRAGFLDEAFANASFFGQRTRQHLDGDPLATDVVMSQVDGAHAPTPELPFNDVARQHHVASAQGNVVFGGAGLLTPFGGRARRQRRRSRRAEHPNRAANLDDGGAWRLRNLDSTGGGFSLRGPACAQGG